MSLSPKQEQLFKQASKHIPGGVNSPVRAFNGVGGTPVFIEKAQGAYLFDVDGKRYVDYVGSWGPMILGPCAAGHYQGCSRSGGGRFKFWRANRA